MNEVAVRISQVEEKSKVSVIIIVMLIYPLPSSHHLMSFYCFCNASFWSVSTTGYSKFWPQSGKFIFCVVYDISEDGLSKLFSKWLSTPQ